MPSSPTFVVHFVPEIRAREHLGRSLSLHGSKTAMKLCGIVAQTSMHHVSFSGAWDRRSLTTRVRPLNRSRFGTVEGTGQSPACKVFSSSRAPRSSLSSSAQSFEEDGEVYDIRRSVTGNIYCGPDDAPKVTLFTRYQCALCDKVVEVLEKAREEIPHHLDAVDITDPEHRSWYAKYKFDIPVLHLGGKYWTKHRLNYEDAINALQQEISGRFLVQRGEPNAERLERK